MLSPERFENDIIGLKSNGNFARLVDFAYWWRFIHEGLRSGRLPCLVKFYWVNSLRKIFFLNNHFDTFGFLGYSGIEDQIVGVSGDFRG